MTNEHDLIRRGDALRVLEDEMDLARVAMPQAIPILRADHRAIAALPAVEAPAHEYRPSVNPDDQGDCAICGNSQAAHAPVTLAAALELPEVRALVEALTLAANRLHYCAIMQDTGSRAFVEQCEWASEARAALRAIEAASGPGSSASPPMIDATTQPPSSK